jgi:uncharacterized protein
MKGVALSEALDVIAGHYAAAERGDLEGMLAPFADAIEWTEMAGFPYAGTYAGPDAVRREVFGRLGREWKGFRADVERIIDGGDGTVVAVGSYFGTYRATGRSMTARFVHLWQVQGGAVTRFEQFADTHAVRSCM